MFHYSKYKLHYIDNLVEGEHSTVYRCGTLVDLCRGPHIQNTGKIKAMKIMQVSGPWKPYNDPILTYYNLIEFLRIFLG